MGNPFFNIYFNPSNIFYTTKICFFYIETQASQFTEYGTFDPDLKCRTLATFCQEKGATGIVFPHFNIQKASNTKAVSGFLGIKCKCRKNLLFILCTDRAKHIFSKVQTIT